MSLNALHESLAGVQRDEFPEGTVIRWTASGRYTYAAVKTPVGWFTTARAMPEHAQHVPQVVSFRGLTKVLAKSDVSRIEVATEWSPV